MYFIYRFCHKINDYNTLGRKLDQKLLEIGLKMQEKLENSKKSEEKIKGQKSVDECRENNIGSILIVKASQQLSKEIEEELNKEDPVDAGQLISKNRVIDE